MSARNALSGAALLLAGLLVGCDETRANPAEPLEARATLDRDEEGDSDVCEGRRVPFSALAIFLELNATDNDLGVQVFLDAEAWNRVQATAPSGRTVLDFEARREVGDLGLTELRFESAEPSPEEVLSAIKAGRYHFRGALVEGGCLDGHAMLSHQLPQAPTITSPLGDRVDPKNTVVKWNPIGGLAGFEVIVSDETTGRSLEVRVGPDATSLHVPREFMQSGTAYKAEVLAIARNGNKTITEVEFATAP
jgi:hypothetical protein